jgi:hypothetical protein
MKVRVEFCSSEKRLVVKVSSQEGGVFEEVDGTEIYGTGERGSGEFG